MAIDVRITGVTARGTRVVTFPKLVHGKVERDSREFSDHDRAVEFYAEMREMYPKVGAAGLAMDASARDEYWSAKRLIPAGVSLVDVAADFVNRHPVGADFEIGPLAEEWLLFKERRDASARAGVARRQRLNAFFSLQGVLVVGDLSVERMESHLWRMVGKGAERRQLARRSAASEASAIRDFCGWLVKRKRLLDRNPMDGVDIGGGAGVPPRAMRADRLRELLAASRRSCSRMATIRLPNGGFELRPAKGSQMGRLIPSLAIEALAGLRPSEVGRLTPDSFSWGEKPFIRVAKLKRGRGLRLAPMADSLVAWLRAYPPEFPIRRWDREFDRARREVGLYDIWKNDYMRDTCISAWLAMGNSENDVAAWAGNKPDVIHTYYRDLMTRDEAAAIFDIWP